MGWDYSFTEPTREQLKKLGRQAQIEILRYLDERVAESEDLRRFGNELKADLSGLWRYRAGDYRILCQIQDHKLIVLIVALGHRRDVYR